MKSLLKVCLARFLAALLPIGACAPEAVAAAVPDEASPEVMATTRCAAIQVDGELTEPAWRQATPGQAFSFPWSQRSAPATEFRALADADRLYFAFEVGDDDAVVEKDFAAESTLDREDRVEIFLARDATLAHLAYANTLAAPRRVKPEPGVFLEFAPIHRRYDQAYAQQTGPAVKDALTALEDNLRVFPVASAQALEYWLDVSRFSQWKRPAVKLPWRRDVLVADAETYARLGLQHVTTFAVWIDRDYVQRYGEPVAIQEYGETLRRQRSASGMMKDP